MPTSSSLASTPSQVLDWARRLAFESPQLTDLAPEELEKVAQFVVFSGLRDDLKRLAGLAKIDGQAELKVFLSTVSPTDSWRTKEIYAWGIDHLEQWLEKTNRELLDLTASQADDYIYWLRSQGRAPATIRLQVAAASAFFSFLERRFDAVRNPFRGSRARPAQAAVRALEVPTSGELDLLLASAAAPLRAAMIFMSTRGFRVGALPTLVIVGDRFSGESKGKAIYGTLPPCALESLGMAGLDRRRPFAHFTGSRLSDAMISLSRQLHGWGRIRAAFSAHDLRHYFAMAEYARNPDLYRLKVLLGHSGIGVTERYLRGLKILD